MSLGWIRTQAFGEVDRVDDDVVRTEFYCVILPIWPQRSYYVHRQGDALVVSEIALHPASVALGYLRITTWMAAWMTSLAVVLAWPTWGQLWPVASGLCALAATLQFVAGRLGADEQERRRLLRRVVGVGAPPEMLPRQVVEATRLGLEGSWRDDHDEPWLVAARRGERSELLAALAEYHGRRDLAAAIRDRLHARDDVN